MRSLACAVAAEARRLQSGGRQDDIRLRDDLRAALAVLAANDRAAAARNGAPTSGARQAHQERIDAAALLALTSLVNLEHASSYEGPPQPKKRSGGWLARAAALEEAPRPVAVSAPVRQPSLTKKKPGVRSFMRAAKPRAAAWASHATLALWTVDCGCGERSQNQQDREDFIFIQCEACQTWQHHACVGVGDGEGDDEIIGYTCPRCASATARRLNNQSPEKRPPLLIKASASRRCAGLVADGLILRHRLHSLLEIVEWGSCSPLDFEPAFVRAIDDVFAGVQEIVSDHLLVKTDLELPKSCFAALKRLRALMDASALNGAEFPPTSAHLNHREWAGAGKDKAGGNTSSDDAASSNDGQGASDKDDEAASDKASDKAASMSPDFDDLHLGDLDHVPQEKVARDQVIKIVDSGGTYRGAFYESIAAVAVDRPGPLFGQFEVVATKDVVAGSPCEFAGYIVEAGEAAGLLKLYDGAHVRKWGDFVYALRDVGGSTNLVCLPYLDARAHPASYVNDVQGPPANKGKKAAKQTPNASFCEVLRKGKQYVFLVAIRTIKRGEVVTVNYGDPYWEHHASSAAERNDLIDHLRVLRDPRVDAWLAACCAFASPPGEAPKHGKRPSDATSQAAGDTDAVLRSFPELRARWRLGALLEQPLSLRRRRPRATMHLKAVSNARDDSTDKDAAAASAPLWQLGVQGAAAFVISLQRRECQGADGGAVASLRFRRTDVRPAAGDAAIGPAGARGGAGAGGAGAGAVGREFDKATKDASDGRSEVVAVVEFVSEGADGARLIPALLQHCMQQRVTLVVFAPRDRASASWAYHSGFSHVSMVLGDGARARLAQSMLRGSRIEVAALAPRLLAIAVAEGPRFDDEDEAALDRLLLPYPPEAKKRRNAAAPLPRPASARREYDDRRLRA
ncbi:hypothetical protein M885DRAFT_504113 [Pelagophyceae sp. CCMP2097]|nr:hypothetical protein M885DRAFT_504113 [Pelagophyceae sp. CCMP2097]